MPLRARRWETGAPTFPPMSITVVKENGVLRILEAPSDLPEGVPLTFVPADGEGADASLAAFVRGEEHDSAADLFQVT